MTLNKSSCSFILQFDFRASILWMLSSNKGHVIKWLAVRRSFKHKILHIIKQDLVVLIFHFKLYRAPELVLGYFICLYNHTYANKLCKLGKSWGLILIWRSIFVDYTNKLLSHCFIVNKTLAAQSLPTGAATKQQKNKDDNIEKNCVRQSRVILFKSNGKLLYLIT